MTLKIQHKRSAVKAKAPQPTDLEYGEIAVNYEASDPCIYIKDSANTIRRIGHQPGALVFQGSVAPTSVAPASPDKGDVYVMTAAGPMAASWTGMAGKNVVQGENIVWDGTKWETLGSSYSPATVTTADTAPTTPKDGDLWYDSVGGELYVWYDSDDAGAVAGTWVQANPQPTPKQATDTVAGVVTLADAVAISAGTAGRVVDAAQMKLDRMTASGPACSVYSNVNQAVTPLVFTKVTLGAKDFDTTNAFNLATSQFSPKTPGYYQINAMARMAAAGGTINGVSINLYKNGVVHFRGDEISGIAAGTVIQASLSHLMYFNGTTDYIELYAYLQGAGTLEAVNGPAYSCRLQAFLARPA